MFRVQGQKSQVKLILSEAIMCLQEKGEEPIPKEHGLIVSHITSQTLGVFSQQTSMYYLTVMGKIFILGLSLKHDI